jgi:hypothetical protein
MQEGIQNVTFIGYVIIGNMNAGTENWLLSGVCNKP